MHINIHVKFLGHTEVLMNDTVILGKCNTTTLRCPLKRNSTVHIEIKFTPGL